GGEPECESQRQPARFSPAATTVAEPRASIAERQSQPYALAERPRPKPQPIAQLTVAIPCGGDVSGHPAGRAGHRTAAGGTGARQPGPNWTAADRDRLPKRPAHAVLTARQLTCGQPVSRSLIG